MIKCVQQLTVDTLVNSINVFQISYIGSLNYSFAVILFLFIEARVNELRLYKTKVYTDCDVRKRREANDSF